MSLRLYDTCTHCLRDFQPLHAPEVGLYSCGPTVYDYAVEDTLQRPRVHYTRTKETP